MTTPADPTRPAAPSVREITALTARLRALSDAGRDADPAERAAFLADKDALLARITDTGSTDADTRPEQTGGGIDADHAGLVTAVSWAMWARDIAIERGDTIHAAVFARDAREALDAAHAAGITREQLAAELDYPGGAAELDGEHIIVSINNGEPVTAAELTRTDAAGDEPAETISRAEAVDRLTELGYDQTSAQTMIVEYLDDTSREVGVPVHQWGLDQHDLDAIADTYGWVDHTRGETLAQARDRAAEHAAGWGQRSEEVDRDRSPGYTARVDTSQVDGHARVWAERARTPEPFTTPPDDHTDDHASDYGDGVGDEDSGRVTRGGDPGEPDLRPDLTDPASDNVPGGWPEMPEEMREQARRAERELTARSATPVPVDGPTEIAARTDALRERVTAGGRDGHTLTELADLDDAIDCGDTDTADQIIGGNDLATPQQVPDAAETAAAVARAQQALADLDTGPGDASVSRPPEQERREQLTRWHTDDQTDHDHDHDHDHDGDYDGDYDGDDAPAVDAVAAGEW